MGNDLTREASRSAEVLYRFGIGGAMRSPRALLSLAIAVIAGFVLPLFAGESAQTFSIVLTVTNGAPSTQFLPLSTFVDFTSLLQPFHITNAVDARSIRLLDISRGGAGIETPYQFTPAEQPRVQKRKLLSTTSKNASYMAEYAAGETTPVRTAGTLTWIAGEHHDASTMYRLEFAAPASGRAIQVPYSPNDLHAFDDNGRATPPRWFAHLQIHPQQPMDGGIGIYDGRELITKCFTGPLLGSTGVPSQYRRPFLYPVNGPDGISLTEFGKSHDPTGSHNHHYSLWIAHNSVNGIDFWSERGGIIAHEQFEQLEDGPVYSQVRQRARWVLGATNLLRETRTVTFYASAGDFRLIDIHLEFTPAASNAVTFGKTSFGFLAARVAQSISPFDGGGEIVNANGLRNEQAVHLQRASWLDQSGPIAQDKWGGLAILDHPDNPGYPTVWHCRNDGWAGAAFNAEQPYVLEPGKMLSLRYRVVLHRHNAEQAAIARRFQEWVARPIVKMELNELKSNR